MLQRALRRVADQLEAGQPQEGLERRLEVGDCGGARWEAGRGAGRRRQGRALSGSRCAREAPGRDRRGGGAPAGSERAPSSEQIMPTPPASVNTHTCASC
jgi:hypothetical protein